MHRLYHDFNKSFRLDEEKWFAPLVCRGTHEDLQKLGLSLQDGMRVVLYQPDIGPEDTPDFLEVEAVVRYEQKEKRYCADFIYADLMYRTEREKKPIQPPQTTTGSDAPGRV